jgi:glycosyltransferase involved in cell wall biosynthesis
MSSEKIRSVSLIIPCYNEGAGLSDLVSACIAAEFPPNFEIILVDNGSTDNTPSMLLGLLDGQSQIRSVRLEENEGYGGGILFGLSRANGDILGWSHADLQADPADFKTAVELFESEEAELLVKGKRFGRPVFDVFFTVCMSIFEILLLRRLFWDINAQPNVFSRHFYEGWENPPKDFSLDLYAYYLAKKTGLKVQRFPVFFGERQYGSSHWNIDWRSKMRFIRRTIGFSFELKKKYD